MADKIVELDLGTYDVHDVTLGTTAQITVPTLLPGTISNVAPKQGDLLTVTGSNATTRAVKAWETSDAEAGTYAAVPAETDFTFQTAVDQTPQWYRFRVTEGKQGPLYTPPILLSVGTFSWASFFTTGVQGAAYEVRPETCFTDTVGGTQAGIGDEVVVIEDLSGNGHHATLGGLLSERLLQQTAGGKYFIVAPRMSCGTIDFSGTDKMTAVIGVQRTINVFGILMEFTTHAGNTNGGFSIGQNVDTYYSVSRGTTARTTTDVFAVTTPGRYLVGAQYDISGDSVICRVNGVAGAEQTGDQGTGNYANAELFIGAREGIGNGSASGFFGACAIGAQMTAQQIADIEGHMADLAEVTL